MIEEQKRPTKMKAPTKWLNTMEDSGDQARGSTGKGGVDDINASFTGAVASGIGRRSQIRKSLRRAL